MPLRKILFAVCLLASVLCLAIGFGITGQWAGAMVAILMGPAWLLARKYPASWLPPICLLASVCLAAAGNLIGASPVWMIFGLGFALAVWDLLLLIDALGVIPAREQTRQYENKHLRSLALALGFGLLAPILGRQLNLQLPFIVLMLLIALAIFGLDRVWASLKKAG